LLVSPRNLFEEANKGREIAVPDLQGLKPLKKAQLFVVPKGTTHKPYNFHRSLLNGLIGTCVRLPRFYPEIESKPEAIGVPHQR
jgi:hypothetical protein